MIKLWVPANNILKSSALCRRAGTFLREEGTLQNIAKLPECQAKNLSRYQEDIRLKIKELKFEKVLGI